MPIAQLINADCLFHTCFMEDNSVDAVVTDPPYALTSVVKRFGGENAAPAKGNDAYVRASAGFMGQTWDTGKVAFDIFFWSQVLRVLKPGGHVLAFSGSRTYHRLACAVEDAGFEIRDQIMWLYGSGFPKSHNEGEGWGTALKPAHEPIVMGRKPLIGTVAANRAKWGTGAINIDGCRVETDDGYSTNRVTQGINMSQTSYAPASVRRTFEPAENGRFPANVIHDGSDEVIEAFPNAPGQQGDLNETGRSRPSVTAYGGMPPPVAHQARKDSGSAARFFYCAKASKSDREEGLSDPKHHEHSGPRGHSLNGDGSPNEATRPRANTHPTVKPTDLMRYLCRLVTPPEGIVYDPFMGSGSTGKAAMLEGFNFIGVDQSEEYFQIARQRIVAAGGLIL